MTGKIMNPGLIAALAVGFASTTCTIQESTPTQGDTGQEQLDWANRVGFVDISARLGKAKGGEKRRSDSTIYRATHRALLFGDYSAILDTNRAVINGINFNILNVGVDGEDRHTVLELEEVR